MSSSSMAALLLTHNPHFSTTHFSKSHLFTFPKHLGTQNATFLRKTPLFSPTLLSKPSHFRIRSFQPQDASINDASSSYDSSVGGVVPNGELCGDKQVASGGKNSSFLLKLAIGLGIAATLTILSVTMKQQTPVSSLGIGIQRLADASSSATLPTSPVGFTFNAFGYRISLPEYTPGWVYFWLLMAAGCGLFISEEALNIWVGISLARLLCLDGTWKSLAESFSRNAPYIISTVLWVYWGVCISDMIPFYVGKLFRQSGVSDDVCSKLGIGKEKVEHITNAVKKYGNFSGFVERLSIGVRNPTAFLAGAMGVSPECFFAGVCGGGVITLSIQLAIGFLLRERPLFAVASVATVVGIWTLFPYVVATVTSLFFYMRHKYSS